MLGWDDSDDPWPAYLSHAWQHMEDRMRDSETLRLQFAIANGELDTVKAILNESQHELHHVEPGLGHPLHVAIEFNQPEILRILIDAQPDINVNIRSFASHFNDEGPIAPLELAVTHGEVHMAKLLWDAGARPLRNQEAKPWKSILATAAFWGHSDLVQNLLEWWKDCPLQVKEQALQAATSRWQAEVVRLLLQDTQFGTAVLNRSLMNVSCGMVMAHELAHETYEDSDHVHEAAQIRQVMIINSLLDAGADVNYQERYGGRTNGHCVLHTAAKKLHNTKALRALLARGADPHVVSCGNTPLQFATRYGFEHPCCWPRSVDIPADGIRALLEYGASAVAFDQDGSTPAHEIAANGTLEMMKVCIEFGVDPNLQDAKGRTLLQAAEDGLRDRCEGARGSEPPKGYGYGDECPYRPDRGDTVRYLQTLIAEAQSPSTQSKTQVRKRPSENVEFLSSKRR